MQMKCKLEQLLSATGPIIVRFGAFKKLFLPTTQFPENEVGEGSAAGPEGDSSAASFPAVKRIRMAEYEVTKMEGVDEDPEISFKVCTMDG